MYKEIDADAQVHKTHRSQVTPFGLPVPNVLLTQVNIGQIYSFMCLILSGHIVI